MTKVGIFYFIDGHWLVDAVPVTRGDIYGDAIEHGSHYDFWECFVPRTAWERKFKLRAYDAYPRGRVVYLTKKKTLVIYADACFNSNQIKRVAEHFGVRKARSTRDEHYQCATCNELFVDL